MERPIENSKEFLDFLTRWQILEDRSIASSQEIIEKTTNPIVRMTMELIKHDSEKHKIVLQMIRDTVAREALHLSPDELSSLSDLLNRHMDAEAQTLAIADEMYRKSELFVTRFLLSYLIADEAKHHGMISKLNELKRASISTSTGARIYDYD
ncbi:MAG: hypothetical protein ACOYW7_07525 [Nitrospirota bacterium]